MALIKVFNGPMPTTASQAEVTTSTSIKTLLQLKASATKPFKVKGWGISFDGSAAAEPGIVELCETDVAATVTAFAAADLHKLDGEALACGDLTTNLLPVGTTSSGYTSSSEGSITAIRQFDVQEIMGTNQYVYDFPLGLEPIVQVSKFLRVRVKFATAVNAICFVLIEI